MLKFLRNNGLVAMMAMLVMVSGISHTTSAHADAAPPAAKPDTAGGQDPCSVTDDSAAHEQCNEKDLAIGTAAAQSAEATAFLVAAIICTVACVEYADASGIDGQHAAGEALLNGACRIAGFVALGVDVAGGVAVTAASAAIQKKVDGGSLAMSLGMTAVGAIVSVAAGVSCPLTPIMDFLQAGIRGVNMGMSIDQANKARTAAKETRQYKASNAQISKVATAGGAAGSAADSTQASATASDPKLLRDMPAADKKKFSDKNFAQSSATAADGPARAVLAEEFKKMTGHSPDDLTKHLLDGESATAAALAVAGDKMGPYTKLVERMDANRDKLYTEFAGAGDAPVGKSTDFEVASAASKHSKSKSDGMPDVSAMLAAMHAKKGAADAPKTAALDFGTKKHEPANAEGLHPPSRSLFDIIDSRYELVQTRFLAGQDIGMRAPASVVTPPVGSAPTNIYLKQ